MAAQALDRLISVPGVDHLFTYGVGGMLLPFVAGPAQIYNRWWVDEEHIVRGMRIVTRRTVSVSHRWVLGQRFFLSLDGVGVTLPAQRNGVRLEKPLLG